MPSDLTYGDFLAELQGGWNVVLVDSDAAIGDPILFRRVVMGGQVITTGTEHRRSSYIFSDDEEDLVKSILRRLHIPENIFSHQFGRN